jgi:hypothetical protein
MPKVLEYDLELFPNEGYTWGKWDQNVIEFTKEKMICSVAWKWQGETAVQCLALPHFYGYPRDYPTNRKLVKAFYKIYKKADITIAHNGDGFDDKHLRTAFILNGCKPPAPKVSIDTLKIARSQFKFNSNKLDDLAMRLGVVKKVVHPGWPMWRGCMRGDKKMWAKMIMYNIGDIHTLEGVYDKIKMWDPKHPDFSNYERTWNCRVCLCPDIKMYRWRYTLAGKKKMNQCKKCGAWTQGPNIRDKKSGIPA